MSKCNILLENDLKSIVHNALIILASTNSVCLIMGNHWIAQESIFITWLIARWMLGMISLLKKPEVCLCHKEQLWQHLSCQEYDTNLGLDKECKLPCV